MADATPNDRLTLLAYAIDEMHDTTSLLRVYEMVREGHRPWWRALFFAAVRTGKDMNADMAVQYLGQNVDRARDHWREALRLVAELRGGDDAFAREVHTQLAELGFDGVLDRLAIEAIPGPRAQAAAYLRAVSATISDCTDVLVKARSKLMLQRMRGRDSS